MAHSRDYEKVAQADDADEPYDLNGPDDEELDDDHDEPRLSEDVRRHDNDTLTAEEEAERLLGGSEKASRSTSNVQKSRRQHRKRDSRRRDGGKDGELMYEMEEGGPRSSSAESSGHSSEIDMKALGETQAKQKKVGIDTIYQNTCNRY